MSLNRRHPSPIRMLWSIVSIVITLYIGFGLLLFLLQAHFIYFPIDTMVATPAERGLAYEAIWFEAADGTRLFGWFVPVEQARGVILFFHGNAGNISHRLESLVLFHRLGLSTFIIDYRGYGRSQGKPTESGTYLDAEAAWRYLVEERQISPQQIIIFGRSLGGAVAAGLAEKHLPQALILESTFTSVPDMAAKQYPFFPVRQLARIHYDTLKRLPRINCPVLIVHSPDDDIIPYSHGQQLFTTAQEPKAFLKIRGGHNEGFTISTREYEAGLDAFITKWL